MEDKRAYNSRPLKWAGKKRKISMTLTEEAISFLDEKSKEVSMKIDPERQVGRGDWIEDAARNFPVLGADAFNLPIQ